MPSFETVICDAPRSVAGTTEDGRHFAPTWCELVVAPDDWTVLASWTSLFTATHTVLERGGNLSIGLGD